MPNNTAVTNLVIKITANASEAIAKIKALEGQVAQAGAALHKSAGQAVLGEQVRGQDARRRMLITQAEFEHRQGLKSAEQAKAVLSAELANYEQFSAKWAAVSRKIAQIDALEARKAGAAARSPERAGAIDLRRVGQAESEQAKLDGIESRGQENRTRMRVVQAQFEYRIGIKSAEQSKAALAAELRGYEEFSLKWEQITRKMADIDAREARKGRAATRQESAHGRNASEIVGRASDGALVAGAAVLGGLGYAAVQAAKFTSEMTLARNNTQMTDQEFQVFQQHALDLGKTTGAAVDQIGQAFMRAKNHGLTMKETLAVVDAATKSAVATGSDVGETANVLSQTMHIFHISGDQAARTMNTLHQASLQGNMTMSELVEHFGLAEAVTSKYGLTLQDTAAAFATMTENGLNAAEAGTQVRDAMQHITNPGKAARAEIEKLSHATGVDLVGDIKALQNGTGSLTKFMVDLNDATHGQAVEINKIIPAQRGAFGAMALTGKAAVDLKRNYEQLVLTQNGKLDPTTAGFNRTLGTLENQIARVNNTLLEMYVKVGPKLIPILRDAAKGVGDLADDFNRLSPETQTAIVKMLEYGGVLLLGAGALGKVGLGAKNLIGTLGGLRLAFMGAGAASTAAAAEGVTAFAAGGFWAAGIGAAIALVWSLKGAWDKVSGAQAAALHDKVWQEIEQGRTQTALHGADGNVDAQVAKNRGESARILASPEFKTAQTAQASATAAIRAIRAGGVQAFTKHGESPAVAMHEYDYALGQQQKNYAEALQAVKKMTGDAKALRADANKMGADSPTTGLGARIAQSAWKKQLGLDRAAYSDGCQRLARETMQAVTPAFNKYFSDSALHSLQNFKSAGLARPYTPGMALPPGTLLYSETMGKRGDHIDGHVQTVGPGGHRYDQHGQDKFDLKNFQYYVLPPGSAGTPAPVKGGISSFDPSAAEKDAAAKKLSGEKADARTTLANMAASGAQDAFKRSLDKLQSDGASMTPAALGNALKTLRGRAAQVETLQNRSAGTELAKDPTSPAAQATYKAALAENARANRDMIKQIADAQAAALEDAKKKREEAQKKARESERKRLEAIHKQQEYELRGLEIARDGALTDAERERAGDRILAKRIQLATTDKKIALQSDDHETRAAAATTLEYALRDLHAQEAQDLKGFDTSRREKYIALLQAQAEATDDLAVKSALLYAIEEKQIADPANADDRPRLQVEAAAKRRKRTAEIADQSAGDSLTGAVYGDKHGIGDYRTLSQAADRNRNPDELGKSALRQTNELLEAVSTAKTNNPESPALDIGAVLPRIKELFAQASDAKDLKSVHEMQAKLLEFWEKLLAPKIDAMLKLPKKERDAGFSQMIGAAESKEVPADVQAALQQFLRDKRKNAKKDKKGEGDEDWSDYRRGMTKSLSDSADEASKTFLDKLLSGGKEKKGAFTAFWSDMVGVGKQQLTKMLYDQVLKKAFSSIFDGIGSKLSSALQGGGSGLVKSGMQFALIVGAAMNLSGANGKKKQKHSLFGAVLGGIAGSFFGAAGTGAEIGANLGGMFAEGGRPPVGRPSLVGEMGREIFVPDVPGTIIPNHKVADYLAASSYAPRGPANSTNQGQTAPAPKEKGGVNITMHSTHIGDIHSGIDVDMINDNLTRKLSDKIRM